MLCYTNRIYTKFVLLSYFSYETAIYLIGIVLTEKQLRHVELVEERHQLP